MSKNPVVPFILIFALGLGLIFFMSLYGLEQKAEIASQGEEGNTEDVASSADFDAEAVTQGKCIGCHGGDLTGGIGPGLVGTSLSADEIKDIIQNGIGTMPPQGITDAAELDAMAEYILSLQ